MLPEIGHYLISVTVGLSIIQMLAPLLVSMKGGARVSRGALGDPAIHRTLKGCQVVIQRCGIAGFLSSLGAFVLLVALYVETDFTVRNVWQNTHDDQPLLYRITAVWGNHEGSMLLWVLMLTAYTAVYTWWMGRRAYPESDLRQCVATGSVQGGLVFAFSGFLLLTSNPFVRQWPAPASGQDLNPILQDVALAIHPPLLYAGYVGFSLCFSAAVAGLLIGNIRRRWAVGMRPWVLISWIMLTGGIAVGSFWAYYELGWGGWWFWDPVENASLLPWLSGTALLHSTIVLERTGNLRVWTVLLALLSFALSLLGTFLVRSGVLTSVHAFANDPERGLYLLILLALVVGGGLFLFCIRGPALRPGSQLHPASREGLIVVNNLLIATACATVMVGTLYPLILESFTGIVISVGPPFYTLVFTPIAVPALLLIPLGPAVAWRHGALAQTAMRLWKAGLLAILAAVFVAISSDRFSLLSALLVPAGFWIIIASGMTLMRSIGPMRGAPRAFWQRLKRVPRRTLAGQMAHVGVGIMVLGIVGDAEYRTERIVRMTPGETVTMGPYTLTLSGFRQEAQHNWQEEIAAFELTRESRRVTTMEPSRRLYPVRGMATSEVAIYNDGFKQIYVSLGERGDEDGIVVRAFIKPFVSFIWIGAIFMMAGGAAGLTGNRHGRNRLPKRFAEPVNAPLRAPA